MTLRSAKVSEIASSINYQHVLNQNCGGKLSPGCVLLDNHIREEKLLQLLLWKMVHFAMFLVKISINFRPGYSPLFFSITVDVSTLQKF
jgi:hypothetical protein